MIRTALPLTVNGRARTFEAEPRTSLADALRDRLDLTGTHLGCEQGACGACTVLLDGVPVRSCITLAASCAGAEVTTVEGFDDDPLMAELRAAFRTHHALQCGYCTPGMLIMARDLVQRLPDADEARIRIEMSGNLCRCTGYAGIVHAIRSVILARQDAPQPAPPAPRGLGPAGSGHAAGLAGAPAPVRAGPPPEAASPAPPPDPGLAAALAGGEAPGVTIRQSFTVPFPADRVWERFADVPAMVACIPGARHVAAHPDGSHAIDLHLKMGPIGARFGGLAVQRRDGAARHAEIRGVGRDGLSGTTATGLMTCRVRPAEDAAAATVEIGIGYALSGALAQFARAGIVERFVAGMTERFAANLERSLSGPGDEPPSPAERPGLGAALRARLAGLLARVRGR